MIFPPRKFAFWRNLLVLQSPISSDFSFIWQKRWQIPHSGQFKLRAHISKLYIGRRSLLKPYRLLARALRGFVIGLSEGWWAGPSTINWSKDIIYYHNETNFYKMLEGRFLAMIHRTLYLKYVPKNLSQECNSKRAIFLCALGVWVN